jgi:hypothetical protein
MLYLVSRSDPWYTNIVNFIVTGYVPLGGDKRKLIYESCVHLWDDPTSSEFVQMGYSEDVY